jgi:hypothetical protein
MRLPVREKGLPGAEPNKPLERLGSAARPRPLNGSVRQ